MTEHGLNLREHGIRIQAGGDVRGDGRHPLLVLASDRAVPVLDAPRGHGHQRHLDAAFGHHGQVPDGLELLSVALGEAHHDVVLVVTRPVLCRLDPIDRPPDGLSDLDRAQVVEGRFLAVDLDGELGPGVVEITFEADELRIDRRGLQHGQHPVRERFERDRILADDLDAHRRALRRALRRLVDRDGRAGDIRSE